MARKQPATRTPNRKARAAKTAREVMISQVMCVRAEMTVRELVDFLSEKQISGAPVVDRSGHLVGVVSATDVVQSSLDGSEAPVGSPFGRSWQAKANADEIRGLHTEDEALQVQDIMTPAVYTVPEETPVDKIARTMIAGRIHRLLVTRDKRVVGIITTLDMLKLLCDNQSPTG